MDFKLNCTVTTLLFQNKSLLCYSAVRFKIIQDFLVQHRTRFLFNLEKSGRANLRWDISCIFLRALGRQHKSYLYIYVLRLEGSKRTSDVGSSINLDVYSTLSSIVSIPIFPVHVLSWLQSLVYLFIQISIFTTPGKTCPQILALDLKSSCGTHMMAN